MDRLIQPKHSELLTSTEQKIRKLGDRIERDIRDDLVAVEVKYAIYNLGQDLFSTF